MLLAERAARMFSDGPEMDRSAFVIANTELVRPKLLPELQLHLVTELTPLWHATAEVLERTELPPPFWAFAWAGGQGLARHVLDHPELVRGKRVMDFATGAGLVGIAAALAGATYVEGTEIDPFAVAAAHLNAKANNVAMTVHQRDVVGDALDGFDVLLAGDVFYERDMAEASMRWFVERAKAGLIVLVGDPVRYYSQSRGVDLVATYHVPTSREIEDSDLRESRVFRVSV